MNSAKSQDIKSMKKKPVAFLYNNNKAAERDIKESISFIIAQKLIKYLEINLTKEVKNLYMEILASL